MKTKPQFPINVGWIDAKLDKNHIDFLWKRIKESKKKNMKHTLAGNISQSFEIEDTNNYFLKEVLSKLVAQYRQSFGKDPVRNCLIYTSTRPRDDTLSRMTSKS